MMGWEVPDCSRGEVAAWQEAWNIGTRVCRSGSAQLCHLTVSPSSPSWSSSSSPSPRGGFPRPSRSPRTATSVRHSPVDCYLDNFEMLSACVDGKAELCCHRPGRRRLAARVPDAVLDPAAPRLYPTGESTTCTAASRSYPPLQTAPSGSQAGRGHLDQPGLAFPGSSLWLALSSPTCFVCYGEMLEKPAKAITWLIEAPRLEVKACICANQILSVASLAW